LFFPEHNCHPRESYKPDRQETSAKVAWHLVCTSKKHGGLGVLDLRFQNKAMLIKNLHKFFNKLDIPWVHFVWEKLFGNGSLPTERKRGSF